MLTVRGPEECDCLGTAGRIADFARIDALREQIAPLLWPLAAEEVSKHAEVPGSKGDEDRHEEAGHHAYCR